MKRIVLKLENIPSKTSLFEVINLPIETRFLPKFFPNTEKFEGYS
jgi:hypothetical protein